MTRFRMLADRRRVLAGAAATAATMAAPAVLRAQGGALKVGVLLPRSGYLAQSGQACYRGAVISPKVLADYGHKVELVHVDTESSADIARTHAERLIDDGAHCLVGPFDSAGAMLIAQVCEQRQVPFVINIAAAPQLTEQGYKYLARNFPTGGQLVRNGLTLIKDLLAVTKVAPKTAVFLHANDTFGTAQRGAMDAIFPKAQMPFHGGTRKTVSVRPTSARSKWTRSCWACCAACAPCLRTAASRAISLKANMRCSSRRKTF